jgi:hypothetical protein
VKPQAVNDRGAGSTFTDHAPPVLVVQGRLARIKGQNIVFSSSKRALYTLNDSAAAIWRALEAGPRRDDIPRGIDGRRVEGREGDCHVEAALGDWARLGLIRPDAPASCTSSLEHVSQVVALPGLRVRIVYPSGLAFPALSVFRHLEVGGDAADSIFEFVEHGDRIHLFRDGDWMLSCSADELPTTLKGQLLSEALDRGAYELALHAAAVVRDDRGVLLCGTPGAGKTTLTLALVHAGFAFAADDVTLVDTEGRCVGLPFAPAVKAGAWPLLSEYCPGLGATPTFRRPDRKRVRYAMPKTFAPPTGRSVGWVILLRRDRRSKARLQEIDAAAALRGLLTGAFAPGGELSSTAFDALTRLIGSAETYCLTYSRLEDAVELIGKACR